MGALAEMRANAMALARFAALSLLVLAPCFWHSRIQAGDLSSHVYNAWLIEQVEMRPVPGLAIVPQYSNVLFDLMLSNGMRLYGADSAQKIAVAACVLIFFWGSFAFVSTAAGRPVWWIAPCLAMLSYGWVFHMGFFNFFLSLGLCLFALSTRLTGRIALRISGLILLPIAWTAHPLPVVWALGVVIVTKLAGHYPRVLFPMGTAALIAMHFAIAGLYPTRWSWDQTTLMTGADQLIPFGSAYTMVALCALLLATTVIWLRARHFGMAALFSSPDVQVLGLLSIAILAMPAAIWISDHRWPLGYLPERMSLTVAVMACVVLARGPVARWQAASCWILLAAYGMLLYGDTGVFNRLEDTVAAKVSGLNSGQRVIVAVSAPDTRANQLNHMVDRACVGHCFSYANYEPCSRSFRLRTTGRNYVVTANCDDSFAMQAGTYKVKADDPAIVQVNVCPGDPIVLTDLYPGQLAMGTAICATEMTALMFGKICCPASLLISNCWIDTSRWRWRHDLPSAMLNRHHTIWLESPLACSRAAKPAFRPAIASFTSSVAVLPSPLRAFLDRVNQLGQLS